MKKIFTILAILVAVVAVNAQNAVVVLDNTVDVWGDGTGYQLLIDTDNLPYEEGYGPDCGSEYTIWEYMIPANASSVDANAVVGTSESLTIVPGTYSYIIFNPGCTNYGVNYIASSNCDSSFATNYVFEAGKMYTFTMSLGENNDCVTISVSDINSVKENSNVNFSIYPNPCNSVLNVQGEEINTTEIVNLLGQTVITSNMSEINISNLTDGVYFVRVNFLNGESKTQKFVKE